MNSPDRWTALEIDAADGAAPAPLPDGAHVVVFAAGTQVRSGGWAGRAALEICRGWGAEGARVVLADVALEDPELHRWAGLDNLEGVTDALLFGTSFQRLGQPLSDGLYLATAGTAVPDGEALRSHPRWRDFAGGFREAGAILALYVPMDAPGADALTALADHAVVLATESEAPSLELPGRLPRIATLGPTSPDADYVAPAPVTEAPVPAEAPPPVEEVLDVEPSEEEEEGAGSPDGDRETDADPDEDGSVVADFLEEMAVTPVEPDAVVVPGLQDDVEVEEEPEEDAAAAESGEREAPDDAPLTTADFGFGEDPFADSDADGEPEFPATREAPGTPVMDPLSVAPADDPLAPPAPVQDPGPAAPTLDEILADGEEALDEVRDDGPEAVDADTGAPVVTRPRGRAKKGGGRGRRGPSPVLLLLLVVVLVGVLVAAYLGYIDIPGMRPMGGGVEEAGATEVGMVVSGLGAAAASAAPEAEASPGGEEDPSFESRNPVVPWVLAVGSFDNLTIARERAAALSADAPGVRFIVAPVEVDGRPFYRLVAGPVTEPGQLAGLRRALAPALGSPDVGYAREARLGFLVGTAPRLPLAERHAGVLEELGIPAHVLQVTAADGEPRYRVYSGAFANPAEARFLGGLLAESGFDDAPLTERRGIWPE